MGLLDNCVNLTFPNTRFTASDRYGFVGMLSVLEGAEINCHQLTGLNEFVTGPAVWHRTTYAGGNNKIKRATVGAAPPHLEFKLKSDIRLTHPGLDKRQNRSQRLRSKCGNC